MYTRPIVAESGYTYKRRITLENRRKARKSGSNYSTSTCSTSNNYSSSQNNINIQSYNTDNNNEIKAMRFPLIYD